jgi:LacI family transcriptional regulator
MRAAAFRKTFSLMRGYPFDPVARKAEIATFARMTIRPASRHPHGQPSIASVAARAGVSIATVSRVVNGVANKASAETTARVRQAILELGYRPISAGRDLRQRSSRIVALLTANLANPAMAAIAAAAEAALRADGLVMVLCDTHDRPDLQDEYLLAMRAQRARAIVLLGAVASPGLARMQAEGETLVFVSRRSPHGTATPFVGIDNRRAGTEVARHLVGRGCADLAVVHGALSSSATAERLAGFRAEARRLGCALPPRAILSAAATDHLEIGYQAMSVLLRRGRAPTGVFCTSDLIAFGAHRRLLEEGLAVPRDLTLVGFDDSPLNDWVAPWLDSVRVPYDSFGPAIARAIAGSPDADAETTLPHRLIVRTQPPPERRDD